LPGAGTPPLAPPGPPPPPDPAAGRAKDLADIERLLGSYRAAYERLDVDAVSKLMSLNAKAASNLRLAWKNRMDCKFAWMIGPVMLSPDRQSANVDGERTDDCREFGERKTRSAHVTFGFTKVSGEWQLRSSPVPR
jgi:hypothetical protein